MNRFTEGTAGIGLAEHREKSKALHAVFIMAHPGDFEQKAGGTASMLLRAGHHVTAISLTNGEAVSHDHEPELIGQIRQRESELATGFLGVGHKSLKLPDTRIFPTEEIRQLIVQQLRELAPEPDIVVTHPSLNDYMDDHSFTGKLVEGAVPYARVPKATTPRDTQPTTKQIALYYTDQESSLDRARQYARVGIIIDVSDVWREKIQAFRMHETQRDHIQNTILQSVVRGRQVGVKFGEAFTQVGFDGFNPRNLLAEALPGYAYTLP